MANWYLLILSLTIYAVLSRYVFEYVYLTSNVVVDEEFHLPLGEQYCRFNFMHWDSKVTTLPGLYIISSIILGPFGGCSIYALRFISLLFSCGNLILLYILFNKRVDCEWQKVFSCLTITFLPPLYSLAHLYYTDVVSLTSILCLIIFNEKGLHYHASIAGFVSIWCRQTNVVFVAMYGGSYVLSELYAYWRQSKDPLKKAVIFPVQYFNAFIMDMLTSPKMTIRNTKLNFWLNTACYISVLTFFLTFVVLNGGIVVGDRNAHNVSINIPQLFYFSIFCLVFGWSYFVGEVWNFLNFTKRHKILISFLTFLAFLVIYFNTVVHPYLLADNRHFVFYIWNRYYGKYWWFRYALIPVYIFALYVIVKKLWDKNDIIFFIMYTVGVSVLLISQSLLELRYFLVPYIVFRLKMKHSDSDVFNVILQFVTNCGINMITFNIFFTKELYWHDMENSQRIIW